MREPAKKPSPQRRRTRARLVADLSRVPHTGAVWHSLGASPLTEQRCARLREALAGALTEKQREAIEAYFFEGLSERESAARLGVTQQVLHKRLYGAPRAGRVVGGALRRLREALATDPLFAALAAARS